MILIEQKDRGIKLYWNKIFVNVEIKLVLIQTRLFKLRCQLQKKKKREVKKGCKVHSKETTKYNLII